MSCHSLTGLEALINGKKQKPKKLSHYGFIIFYLESPKH